MTSHDEYRDDTGPVVVPVGPVSGRVGSRDTFSDVYPDFQFRRPLKILSNGDLYLQPEVNPRVGFTYTYYPSRVRERILPSFTKVQVHTGAKRGRSRE